MRKIKRRFKVEMFVDTFDIGPRLVERDVSIAIDAAIDSELVELKHVCFVRAKFEKVLKR